MELCWTNFLSLLVLQIVAAQDEYCPEEESCDVSLPQVPYIPSTPTLYPPQYFQPQISSAPYVSSPCPYQPSLPPLPYQECRTDVELTLPSLPEISLEIPLQKKQSYCCEKSYSSPPCLPLYKKPKYGVFFGKSGSLLKKKPCCSLKQKCLAKKIKWLNKLICKLYKPSLLEKKCATCEYPAYEGYGGYGYGGCGGCEDYVGYDGYEGYYPPPYSGYY